MSAIGDLEFTLDVRSGQDFDLEIYDSQAPDGFLGGSYGGAGSDETVRITMSYSGPYYALVYTYGSSSGDYTISNESIEPKPDLTPYQPSGWSDKLIVSDIKGKYNSSRIETFCGLGNIFRAIQNQCKGNDYKTYKTMELVLNGMLNNARNRYGNLEENLEKVKWVGHVAIVKDIKGINGKVFRMGAKAIVYSQGNDIGAIRNSDFENIKLDGLMVRKFIACRGEHWNYREGGNFICWGCRKSPADERSKIKDEELAEVINLEITQQLYPLIGDKIEEF